MPNPANASTALMGHRGYVVYYETPGNDLPVTAPQTPRLIARTTQWSVSVTVAEVVWGDSDSQGYTNRAPGRKDLTGSITGKLDKSFPTWALFEPMQDIVGLALFADAANPPGAQALDPPGGNMGTTQPANRFYELPRALITSYDVSVNKDTKEAVEWTSNFGADGIFFRPGQAGSHGLTLPTESSV